jgi:UDP-N-acetylmuramoylalanine--D-glutamate ligase
MPSAHVIGLGKSGIAAARLLKRDGWEVTLSDRNSSESLQNWQQELKSEGIAVKLGYSFEPTVETLHATSLQLVVVSPGVPWDVPALVNARKMGIETIGEMELAWRYLQSCPWVGITGTNGKTTTTALIAAIFQAAGFNAPACGNIGYAVCELALTENSNKEEAAKDNPPIQNPKSKIQNRLDWVIAELSSYQIESSPSVAPRIGVWTTFTPDHLSRHRTLENYYNIKAHLLRQSQHQVFNGDDPYLRKMGVKHWPDACWTSVKGKEHLIGDPAKGVYIENGWIVAFGEQVIPATSLKMPGEHNQQNLLMAVAAARLAGIEKDAIAQAIANFPGVPHRLEHICTWQEIDFINDSKATNYDAAEVGLSSVNSPVILIAGGEAKEGDDTAWLKTIQNQAAAVLLIGDAATAFASRLKEIGYSSHEIVETMEKAIPRAAELAKQYDARVVLLSPACASFDQYQNFEQRGDHFRQLCQQALK